MSKIGRLGQYGEIGSSKSAFGTNSAYPSIMEGMVFNSEDSSLSARKAMGYVTTLQNTGVTKDVFECYIRDWRLVFSNITDGVLIEIFDKKKNELKSINVAGGFISTFAYVMEIKTSYVPHNNSTNPIKGDSIIFIAGINKSLCYIDDDIVIKKWLCYGVYGSYKESPIVEDIDLFQSRLGMLVPSVLGATTAKEDVGINSPRIYLSLIGAWDDFRNNQLGDNGIEITPKNYHTAKFYAITAFRNVLAVLHSDGLSIVKSKDQANEGLTQTNIEYYPSDSTGALPIKAVGFNNILIYLSKTGLRGRTLIEDPYTNQMQSFKIPIMCQRFVDTPTRMYVKNNLSQLCIFNGHTLYSFCEAVATQGGGQLFPRTTYIASDEHLQVLATNRNTAVLQIGDARFLVEDKEDDILSLGIIDNYFPVVDIIGSGDYWIELQLTPNIQKVAILIDNQWHILYRSDGGRFIGYFVEYIGTLPPNVQIVPLEGSDVFSILPPAMRNNMYQWRLLINGNMTIITGDTVSISATPLTITNSVICAYAKPLSITIRSTTAQYGPSTIASLYLLTDRDCNIIATFNMIAESQQPDSPVEYKFKVNFTSNMRELVLKITPTLGKASSLTIEQFAIED